MTNHRSPDSGQSIGSPLLEQGNTTICPHCGKRYYGLTFIGGPYQFVCGPTAGCGKSFEVNPMPAIQLSDQQAVDFYDRYIEPELQKKPKQESPLPDIEQQTLFKQSFAYFKKSFPLGHSSEIEIVNAYIAGHKASLSKSFTEDEIKDACKKSFDFISDTEYFLSNLKSKKEGV